MSVDVSVVIVNYNTRDLLDACLQSLRPDQLRTEVIVIDNGSSDGSKEMVRSRHQTVRLIENATNRGFAAANNLGIRQSSGTYVLLLNSDTTVTKGAIEDTVRFMEEKELKGIVGCRLLNPDGTLQPSVRSFPSLMNVASETFFLFRIFPRSRIFGSYYMTFFDYSIPAEVDWMTGAFLMIHRSVFESIGLFDERFFMYSEEVDFCYRARQAGFPCWYFPGASIFHHWGASTKALFTRLLWAKGSQLLLFQKYAHGMKRYTMYVLLLAGLIVRVPFQLAEAILFLKSELIHRAYCHAKVAIVLPFRFVSRSIFRSP